AHRALHLDRAIDGAGRVIRKAQAVEDHQNAVPDERINDSTMLEDDVHHDIEIAVENFDDRFGWELFGEWGEAAQVAQQDRHRALLPTKLELAGAVDDILRDLFGCVATERLADE